MVNKNWIKGSLLILVIIALIYIFGRSTSIYDDHKGIPFLPRPIAEEVLLITSAGQSTDTYIIKDVTNKLMINNYFMPQATDLDLEGINTVAVVIGYSEIGEKLHEQEIDDEADRIRQLLKMSQSQSVSIIAIYIGGKERRGPETDFLIETVLEYSDYVISTKSGNYDDLISNLSTKYDIPYSLVTDITEIKEPLVSAFR